MNLRLRLTLVILAVVAVMGVVSLISLRLNRGIEEQVASLDRTATAPLELEPLVGQAFSLEGRWDERGHFLAGAIERLPRSRRPKLRASVQALDGESGVLTLLGRRIVLASETEYEFDVTEPGALERLHPGARVEVSCRVESDGTWVARKVETTGVKQSDKVKGTITRADLGASGGRRLSIDGLEILVPRDVEVTFPSGPLYRMEIATQMMLSIEEALAAAQGLLKQRYREKELRARGDLEGAAKVDRAVEDAADRLEDAVESFSHYLAESRAAAEQGRFAQGLEPLEKARASLDGHVARLLGLAGPDPNAAAAYLQDVLEPSLRTQAMPDVRAWLLATEQDLGDELAAIASRASSAARLAVVTNVVGIVLAVAAGLLVSRSVSRPILDLSRAAERIGHGDLATRVELRSQDEIGRLGVAFNRMAEELAATTVSVERLDDVLDSMAGALLILDSDGRIASVNPAALQLLGYQRSELVGHAFTVVCPSSTATPSAAAGGVVCEEREFRRKDGSTLPVSFSSAALRGLEEESSGWVCLALDLSGRKRLEEELRRSLSEKELLLREVHHRVKNNLQVISSLLDLQSRSICDPESLVRFQESQDRIRSMVFIHEQLHRTDDLESVDLQAYLELLVAHLAQSHVDPPGRLRLRTELEALRIDLDRALACGLIVNELVTNALRHAFAPDAQGEVVVSCRATADGTVALEVADDGRGLVNDSPAELGSHLGLSLVETLARQLRGRLITSAGRGASFRVEFPLGVPEEVA